MIYNLYLDPERVLMGLCYPSKKAEKTWKEESIKNGSTLIPLPEGGYADFRKCVHPYRPMIIVSRTEAEKLASWIGNGCIIERTET